MKNNLEQKIRNLEGEILQLQYYKIENNSIKNLLDLNRNIPPKKIIYAKSFINFGENITNTILINLGYKDGIKENNLVISEFGILGRVKKLEENISVVTLLTDVNFKIQVVGLESNVKAIAKGYGIGQLKLEYIDNINAAIKIGEKFISVDTSNDNPGYFVGRVIENKEHIILETYNRFDNLFFVSIISSKTF